MLSDSPEICTSPVDTLNRVLLIVVDDFDPVPIGLESILARARGTLP